MLQQTTLILTAFFLLFPAIALSQTNQPVPYKDSDAYEIYSTILSSQWAVRVAKAKTLVIRAETSAKFEMCLRPDPESEKIIGGAISNYLEVNKKTWLIQKKFNIETPYKIVSSEAINAVFEKNKWEEFYKQYPDSGGYIELSAVGFNADKTVAIVYSGHSCGGLCGGGDYAVLQKKDGKWVPLSWRGSSCSWAS
jgi:hypothetical protein